MSNLKFVPRVFPHAVTAYMSVAGSIIYLVKITLIWFGYWDYSRNYKNILTYNFTIRAKDTKTNNYKSIIL